MPDPRRGTRDFQSDHSNVTLGAGRSAECAAVQARGTPADVGDVDRAYDVQSVELRRDGWKMYAESAPQANA